MTNIRKIAASALASVAILGGGLALAVGTSHAAPPASAVTVEALGSAWK